MKKAFTIVEVSILFVIFLIVAMLVAPLSLDDTRQAQNIAAWKRVQPEFSTIIHSVFIQKESENYNFERAFETALLAETGDNAIKSYSTNFLNGNYPDEKYSFFKYYKTQKGAVVAYKLFNSKTNLKGILMYDVNGIKGPNTWGKDIFGYYIYENTFEPFGKNDDINIQKQDCSKGGTGLCCSNYYLMGGSFH